MSVILTTGRKTAKKLREGQAARQAGKQTSSRPRTASEPPSRSYKPTASTIVWNHIMNNTKLSFAFSTTTMVLWCNDHPIDTRIEFTDDGSQRDFVILDRKGTLIIRQTDCMLNVEEDCLSCDDVLMADKEEMLPQQCSDGAKAISCLQQPESSPAIIYELYIDGQYIPQTLPAKK